MTFLQSIGESIKGVFNKRSEEKIVYDRVKQEQEGERRQVQETAFKESILRAEKIKAEQDAGKLSGLAKLRAIKKKHSGDRPKSEFFENMSAKIANNRARREENLKRTAELRKAAQESRERRLVKTQQFREQRQKQGGIHGI
jgi:hypothetical protein